MNLSESWTDGGVFERKDKSAIASCSSCSAELRAVRIMTAKRVMPMESMVMQACYEILGI